MIPRHLQITFVLLLAGIFGAGAYMLHLKDAERARVAGGERPVAPPLQTPAEPVTLYLAYDGEGVLAARTVSAPLPAEPSARAQAVLRLLLGIYMGASSPHPIGPGSDVNQVFVVNHSLAVIDLNQAFVAGHRSGVWEETLTVDSMLATLAANVPGLLQVKFLVNGQERQTLAGHADLERVYDLGQVNKFVQQMANNL